MKFFILTLSLSAILTTPVTAQNYSRDDFAGMGISAGQAKRLADQANQNNSGNFHANDFRGLGVSQGTANRAADHLNSQNNNYGNIPTYQNQFDTNNNLSDW